MRSLRFRASGRVLWNAAVAAAVGVGLSACVVAPPPRTVMVPAPPVPKVFVYPSNGQTPEQTDRDRYECHTWAVQQTGVDPGRQAAYQPVVVQPSPPPGAATATGAVAGAVVGSIVAGPYNSGAGLLLGAAAGAIVGSAADANAQAQAKQAQQQINQTAAAAQAGNNAYLNAFASCMQGRGYSVK
jgi:outer membrane lipoprotein SlyB